MCLLKKHFDLLNAVLEADFKKDPYKMADLSIDKFLLLSLAIPLHSCKEKILQAIASLDISSRDLTMSLQQVGELFAMGFILRVEHADIGKTFKTAIETTLLEHFFRLV